MAVGREDDGSGLLIHRSESSNIGSNPILSAKYKGQKLVWYSGGLLNRGEWDRYPPGPQKIIFPGSSEAEHLTVNQGVEIS